MPRHATMLAPVFALAAWTFLVLTWLGASRILAAQCRQIVPADFKLGESAQVPEHVCIANRNYMNLLELPVLFYVVCLLIVVTGIASPTLLALAWAYVGLRVLHSLVHLSYNHVLHRLAVFATSNGVLAVMWTLAGRALMAA